MWQWSAWDITIIIIYVFNELVEYVDLWCVYDLIICVILLLVKLTHLGIVIVYVINVYYNNCTPRRRACNIYQHEIGRSGIYDARPSSLQYNNNVVCVFGKKGSSFFLKYIYIYIYSMYHLIRLICSNNIGTCIRYSTVRNKSLFIYFIGIFVEKIINKIIGLCSKRNGPFCKLTAYRWAIVGSHKRNIKRNSRFRYLFKLEKYYFYKLTVDRKISLK